MINYYAPNVEGAQITVLSEINDIINNLVSEEDTTILWGGDFNSFFDVKFDADGGSPQLKEKSICKLITMMSQFDLCDIFRVRHPKGQLQRFYKLISNDRIWPSEHGFEVIFEKSLFVFEISAFKVRNKHGIHSRFHSFSENINWETFVGDVTSDQSSMISTQRSDLT